MAVAADVVLVVATGLAAMATAAPSSGSYCYCPAVVVVLAVMAAAAVAVVAKPAETFDCNNLLCRKGCWSQCPSQQKDLPAHKAGRSFSPYRRL